MGWKRSMVAAALSLWAYPASAATLAVTQYGVAATALPWGIARDQALFTKNSLDIDNIIGSPGGGTSIRNMMASDLPFGEVATSAGIAAVQNGIGLLFVYSANNNTGNMAWVTLPGSPVAKLEDLKGRKAGYTNPRSTTEMLLRITLHAVRLDRDVGLVATGGISGGLTMVQQGIVDASAVDDPAFEEPGKYRTLFYVRDHVPNVTWTVGVTTPAFAKAHPQEVRALILVHRQAVEYLYAHPDDAAKVFAKDWQIAPALAEATLRQLLKSNYFSRGDFNMAGLQTMVQGMEITGALKKSVDVGALIDRSFLPEDLR